MYNNVINSRDNHVFVTINKMWPLILLSNYTQHLCTRKYPLAHNYTVHVMLWRSMSIRVTKLRRPKCLSFSVWSASVCIKLCFSLVHFWMRRNRKIPGSFVIRLCRAVFVDCWSLLLLKFRTSWITVHLVILFMSRTCHLSYDSATCVT